MKQFNIVLAGLAMLMLTSTLRAEITAVIGNNSITVTTDQKGEEGYRGCDMADVIKSPAYIYDLQYKPKGESDVCSVNDLSLWKTLSKKSSSDPSIIFESIPEGLYRVHVYSGQAIGCDIMGDTEDYPSNSIVYEKEKSPTFEYNHELNILTRREIEFSVNNDLHVYPNPARGKLNIALKGSYMQGKIDIMLYDILGTELHRIEKERSSIGTDKLWSMDISQYPPGAYLIRAIDEQGEALFQKVVFSK